ncbi:MAG: prepilin-type N-terminal cleavage/methylation domain-containing protein [bacterium]
MQHKQKSFTLIEMLIVVVIIGILAAALIPRLQPVQARARDTKRKADLHQIGTALEIYKEDNG